MSIRERVRGYTVGIIGSTGCVIIDTVPGRLLIPFSLLLGASLENPTPVLFTPNFAFASTSTGSRIPGRGGRG